MPLLAHKAVEEVCVHQYEQPCTAVAIVVVIVRKGPTKRPLPVQKSNLTAGNTG
jgi:hypothetical protein